MTANKISAEDMLQRAYEVSTEDEKKALYDDWAESYDATMVDELDYQTPVRTAVLLSKHMRNNYAAILDVGCGTGLAGQSLAEMGHRTIDALDYLPSMLEMARRRKAKSWPVYRDMIEADLNTTLDLADGSYDAMICTGLFTHGHVGADCLDELFRVLKPGGLFACTIHKDVWQSAGFAQKADQLTDNGMLATISMAMGKYFGNDVEDQGWYIVWEKPA